MIKSKTLIVMETEMLDTVLMSYYNNKNKEVLSHTITAAGLSNEAFDVLSSMHDDNPEENTKVPAIYSVTFLYKEIHDIDVG